MRKILDMISAQQVQCCDVDFSFEIDWEASAAFVRPVVSDPVQTAQGKSYAASTIPGLCPAVGKEEDSAQQVCPVPWEFILSVSCVA